MFGIPLDTFIGQDEDFYRYVHPEDRQLVAKANAAGQAKPQAICSGIPRRSSGRHSCLAALPDNTFTPVMAILIACWALQWDITARRQAEQAQRESEDKLRLILDSTAEAIYGSDREGRCTFATPPAFTYWAMNEQTNFSARICII